MLTESFECPAGFARCVGSRQCIRNYLFCDYIENCDLGTDENRTLCGKSLLRYLKLLSRHPSELSCNRVSSLNDRFSELYGTFSSFLNYTVGRNETTIIYYLCEDCK